MSKFFSFNPPINLLKIFEKFPARNLECRHRNSQVRENIALFTIKDIANQLTWHVFLAKLIYSILIKKRIGSKKIMRH